MSCRRLISHTLLVFALLMPLAAAYSLAAARPNRTGKAHKAKPRQAILAIEQQWRTATLSGDATQMEPLLSDDYVGISWSGMVSTKHILLERLRKRTIALTRLDLSDVKLKIVGPVGIVTAQADVDGMSDGADIRGTFRYTRVYQQMPSGAWKITNFEATRVPISADRSALNPPATPRP